LVAAVTSSTLSNLRTELEVVRACARDIATLAGERCALIEYGSGAGVKLRLLLDAFALENHPVAAYVPIDLSREQNETASRVEMHLVSLEAKVVHVAGERIAFEAGESIWTESSYKCDRETLDALLTSAGVRSTRLWTDAAERFRLA
jgi:uncharacterized SAM-dependent methyltransferase